MNPLDPLTQIFTGKQHVPPSRPTGAQEGVVFQVAETEAIVVIPTFSRDKRFGPMPFGRTETPPEVGDKCLVMFVGTGIDKSWLVAWTAPE